MSDSDNESHAESLDSGDKNQEQEEEEEEEEEKEEEYEEEGEEEEEGGGGGEGEEEEEEEEEAKASVKKPRLHWAETARFLHANSEHRQQVMDELIEKAGEALTRFLPKYCDNKPKSTDVAGWKLKGETHQKDGCTVTRRYTCPLAHRCKCAVQMRIIDGPKYISLQFLGQHDADSHQRDRSKYLTAAMKGAITAQVLVNPLKTAGNVRRELESASPAKRVPRRLTESIVH